MADELEELVDLEGALNSYYNEEDPAPLSHLFMPFSYFFDLGPEKSIDDNFHHDLEMEMPLSEAYVDEDKMLKGKY